MYQELHPHKEFNSSLNQNISASDERIIKNFG